MYDGVSSLHRQGVVAPRDSDDQDTPGSYKKAIARRRIRAGVIETVKNKILS